MRSPMGVVLRAAGAIAAAWAIAGVARPAAAQDQVKPDAPYPVIARQAARQTPPLWKLPLGAVRVDVMRPAGTGRLLVGLRKDDAQLPNAEYLMVRLDDGTVLWRVRREAEGTSQPLLVLDDAIVLSTVGEKKYTLSVVASETGKERWKRSFKDEDVEARPAPAADRLLLERRHKDKLEVTALGLSDGRDAWRAEFRVPAQDTTHPPLTWPDGALLFYEGVARLRLADGAVVWARPDLVLAPADPPPQIDETTLYVACGGAVVALDLETGATRWTFATDGYAAVTNIYPDTATVYLRGIANAAGRQRLPGTGAFVLTALGRADGALRWHRRTVLPTVSNLVRVGGRLFAATPEHVLAFNAATGEPLFDVAVAPHARLYPVRLRAYADRVAFLGEYVIVALDTATGAMRNRVGVTPLSQKASLAGLDAAIPRLQSEIADLSTGLRRAGGGIGSASWASGESSRYQNLANQYHNEASSKQSLGDGLGASLADQRSQMNSAWSRQMANVAFVMSLLELGQAFHQAALQKQITQVQGLLEHQLLFRESILSGYALAESGDYVVRPDLSFVDDGAFAGVVVLHLPTGRRRNAIVSASYDTHGLWNLYDPDRGVLYHEGIGLDTAAYVWSAGHSSWPSGKVRTIETYLIATPVTLP
jgi:outer membrane protein assembly factor BamB